MCEQQKSAVDRYLVDAETRILTGKHGVDTWTSKLVWDTFLKNVNVVLSTYETLRSAVSYAYVSLGSISLLVVDEAHHAKKKHPLKLLMAYVIERREAGGDTPAILGLSASPVANGDVRSLSYVSLSCCVVSKD